MKKLILPLTFWLVAVVAMAIFLIGLSGCASTEETVWHRICYEQFIGKAENGMMVVRHFCVSESVAQGQQQ